MRERDDKEAYDELQQYLMDVHAKKKVFNYHTLFGIFTRNPFRKYKVLESYNMFYVLVDMFKYPNVWYELMDQKAAYDRGLKSLVYHHKMLEMNCVNAPSAKPSRVQQYHYALILDSSQNLLVGSSLAKTAFRVAIRFNRMAERIRQAPMPRNVWQKDSNQVRLIKFLLFSGLCLICQKLCIATDPDAAFKQSLYLNFQVLQIHKMLEFDYLVARRRQHFAEATLDYLNSLGAAEKNDELVRNLQSVCFTDKFIEAERHYVSRKAILQSVVFFTVGTFFLISSGVFSLLL